MISLAAAAATLGRHLFGGASKRTGYAVASTYHIYVVVHDQQDCPETWEGYPVVVERR